MTSDLANVLKQVKNLSFDELLTLQEQIARQLRTKEPKHSTSKNGNSRRKVIIPGAYQPSIEEIETGFAATFTPEELAEMDKVDLENLPLGAKSLSEMVNEEREDRL
jgi:hypothetical protein